MTSCEELLNEMAFRDPDEESRWCCNVCKIFWTSSDSFCENLEWMIVHYKTRSDHALNLEMHEHDINARE
jgi:hypothetical protein